jgi:hypothetical protein
MSTKTLAALAFAGVVIATSAASAGTIPPFVKVFTNITVAAPIGATPSSLASVFCVSQGLMGSTAHQLGLRPVGISRPSLFFASISCALIPI